MSVRKLVDSEYSDGMPTIKYLTGSTKTPSPVPFKPEFSDLDYADVDYRSYGPINYKAASIALLQKQQAQRQRDQQLQQRRPQMYGVSDENEELL
ncbi:hypothetical protein WN55_05702 [Dufourea novaeangliae]|uniref:Uncharacterized protein n=1 Tax=Dufourea novaeangliae TaxID=178035 RepID=A0A154PPK5_DUFNO|nr:hypothetical protein WN55_05702 [Dufourea novaeangliae]